MYSSIQLAFKYIRYYLSACNGKGHGIHSPFVFDFISNVLNDKMPYAAYDVVENLRQQLLSNQGEIIVQDFGAGSGMDKSDKRLISSIAKNAIKPKKYSQLLYRMAQYYKPKTILELGTSLGITTSYLSLAKPDANIITMEGAKSVASVAEQNFEKLQTRNIKIVTGNFDDRLQEAIRNLSSIDFAFLDGNHRFEPTVHYFTSILNKINSNSVFVVDDIHWSAGMERAWQVIRNHDSVKCTIDLFFIGIIFFRSEFREKQHFVIRF